MDIFFDPLFGLFGQPVSWAELIGDSTGLLCVWWLTRQVIWNWPVGLVNNVFFFALFADAHLFGNAVLQIVYFVVGVYGWWAWARPAASATASAPLVVRRMNRNEWLWITAGTVVFWPIAWWFLVAHTHPAEPAWDSLTLTLSLIATWAQARKLLESWWIYIVVDAVSVPLFLSQDLGLTAALYLVFGALCVIGLRDWQRSIPATVQLEMAT